MARKMTPQSKSAASLKKKKLSDNMDKKDKGVSARKKKPSSFMEIKILFKDFLDKGGWKYAEETQFEEEGLYVVKGIIGGFDGLKLACRFLIFVRADAIESYAISNLSASETYKQSIAEFITRANYGMRYGKFEMDWRDGEIRYHLLRSAESICSNPYEVFDQLMRMPASMLHKYTPGLIDVLMGRQNAESAVKSCETDSAVS